MKSQDFLILKNEPVWQQLITLKTNTERKKKKSSIYPVFPIQMIFCGNQIIDKGRFFFLEFYLKMQKDRSLNNQHSVTHNEIMDLVTLINNC